jgi:PAS domain S-box-containing protein
LNARRIPRPPDKIKMILLAFEDLTERIGQETAARLRLASFPELNPMPIAEIDQKGELTYANPAAKRLFPDLGKKQGGHPFLAELEPYFSELGRSGNKYVSREVKVGDEWYSQTISLVNPGSLRVYSDNISERRRMEEDLKRREEKFRKLFETMVQGVVYQAADGKIISANPAAERILGLSLEQMQGRTSIDPRWKSTHEDGSAFPGETHPAMAALKTGQEVRNVVMRVYNPKEDKQRWININAVPLFRPGENKPYQVYATFEDITERRRAEEKLKESEDKYRTIIENTKDIIYSVDTAGKMTYASPQVSALGYRVEEVVGSDLSKFVHPDDLGKLSQDIQETLATGREFPTSFRLLKKDGSYVYAEEIGKAIRLDGKISGITGVIRDITERKRADDQLTNKVKELEKLARIMEGREDKIIELKQRVKELEARLK